MTSEFCLICHNFLSSEVDQTELVYSCPICKTQIEVPPSASTAEIRRVQSAYVPTATAIARMFDKNVTIFEIIDGLKCKSCKGKVAYISDSAAACIECGLHVV